MRGPTCRRNQHTHEEGLEGRAEKKDKAQVKNEDLINYN